MPYGKVYNGVDEVSVRFDNFKANVVVIRTTNAKHLSFWLRSTDAGRVCRNALGGKKTSEHVELACPARGHTSLTVLRWLHLLTGAREVWYSRKESGKLQIMRRSFSTTGALQGGWGPSARAILCL